MPIRATYFIQDQNILLQVGWIYALNPYFDLWAVASKEALTEEQMKALAVEHITPVWVDLTINIYESSDSMSCTALDDGAYLHAGYDDAVIQVVGIAKAELIRRVGIPSIL